MPHTWDPDALEPEAAITRLLEGNRRFWQGCPVHSTRAFSAELAVRPQRPFAIVLGCSDSRTPIEVLFDEGFGDLFVVRVAGNVVAPSVVGSIEFAASQFGTRLVLVLGHTQCGAIAATLRASLDGGEPESRNIRSIVDRIRPHIEPALRLREKAEPATSGADETEFLRELVRMNVRASVDHLRHGSKILEDLVVAGRVAVVGADYELETGRVTIVDRG